MFMNNPAKGIISDSMAEVLRAIDRMTPGRTGRVLARACEGVSVTQVNAILRRLEQIGVIRADAVPPAKQYFINREHVFCEPLLALANARQEAFSWLAGRLENLPGLLGATVFGSVARKTDEPNSDLDLLLVFRGDPNGAAEGQKLDDAIFEIERAFFDRYGNSLGIVRLSQHEISPNLSEQSKFVQNVIRDGRVIVGEGLTQISERLRLESAGPAVPQSSQ
jgi:predicted nucleotidyltransferase